MELNFKTIKVLLILINLSHLSGRAQTVFFEDFSACSNSGVTTSGNDNISGVAWSTSCPGSIAATDYFICNGSGQLEAQDTNSPEAVWTTGLIDVSSCIGSEITFDISQVGDMEGCADCGGTGATCVDFIKVEYNLDGAGWIQLGAQTCGLGLTAGNNHIQIGDIAGGTSTYTSTCIDFGNTLQIRIACMCWAASEQWEFDNIAVNCNNCVLSVNFDEFEIENHENQSILNWSTFSETDNEKFVIEKSIDGTNFYQIGEVNGNGSTNNRSEYSFTDNYREASKIIYYRLKQVDFNGNFNYSKIRTLSIDNNEIIFNSISNEIILPDSKSNHMDILNVYDLSGKLVLSSEISNSLIIEGLDSGIYILELKKEGLRKKIFIQ